MEVKAMKLAPLVFLSVIFFPAITQRTLAEEQNQPPPSKHQTFVHEGAHIKGAVLGGESKPGAAGKLHAREKKDESDAKVP
jgi:hypothetical protein